MEFIQPYPVNGPCEYFLLLLPLYLTDYKTVHSNSMQKQIIVLRIEISMALTWVISKYSGA